MKKTLFILLIIFAIFTIASCGSRDAEYYLSHPQEMKAKMEECKKISEAEKMTDRECVAVSQANMKKQFDMGPARPSPLAGKGNSKERPKF